MNDLEGLLIDNYDSFTYNLAEYVGEAAEERGMELNQDVIYNDELSVEEISDRDYDFIVISPGPGRPENEGDIGVINQVLTAVSNEVPTLGVCLGLEAAVYAYGGSIGKAPEPVHGKAFEIYHNEEGVFKDIESPFHGARYHSLVAEEVPDSLEVTATTEHKDEELVMGVRHHKYPIEAVQFHPESILTGENGRQNGYKVIGNFLDSFYECL